MKTKRYERRLPPRFVKLALIMALTIVICSFLYPDSSRADQSAGQPASRKAASTRDQSEPEAIALVQQMLDFIGNGPAFDAKVRETVWTSGREVVGVGTYEQAGGGSGQYNLQVTMHDGDGKHRLQQISDGKLAWTRTEIAGKVSLRRVDVGRLEDWVRGIADQSGVSPKLKVGAWGELLDSLLRDYSLRTDTAKWKSAPSGPLMRVVIGDLKPGPAHGSAEGRRAIGVAVICTRPASTLSSKRTLIPKQGSANGSRHVSNSIATRLPVQIRMAKPSRDVG